MMTAYADKTRQNIGQSVEGLASQKSGAGKSDFQFADNRPEAIAQRKLQESVQHSPRTMQRKSSQRMANNSQQGQQAAQLHALLKGENKTGQRAPQPMPAAGTQPVQMIRIKLDHGADPIMNNVRAASAPRAGRDADHVDGLNNYNPGPAQRPIGHDENIILEGHGTYLAAHHAADAPYDSQAYLGPRQLANVAALVPKPAQWKGHIILFGCNTGPLTAAVSGYYRALTGNPVNVVGTLADIRMEVPGVNGRNNHRAEYDPLPEGGLPRAPAASVSGRARYIRWLTGASGGANAAMDALQAGREAGAFDGNEEARDRLRARLSIPLVQFNEARTTSINYEGGARSDRDIAQAREMIHVTETELSVFVIRLADPQDNLDDKATELSTFFAQLITDFDAFDRQAMADAAAVPDDVVDWEGSNVLNSMATAEDAAALPGAALPRHALRSDRWGGGGAMLAHAMVIPAAEDNELV